MDFVLADKEIVFGTLGGTFYGSSVRLLARTPERLIFTGCDGVRGFDRLQRSSDFNDHHTFAKGRASAKNIEAGREGIDLFLGAGGADIVLQAWKAKKTAIIDGGGAIISPPSHILRQRYVEKRAAEACDVTVDLTGQIATCLQCGKNLRPHTVRHDMGFNIKPDHPQSIEDCQRLDNHRVIEVSAYRDENKFDYVQSFRTWDGETTEQDTFCDDRCAALYGRRAAQQLSHLPIGGEPSERSRPEFRIINHFDEQKAAADRLVLIKLAFERLP